MYKFLFVNVLHPTPYLTVYRYISNSTPGSLTQYKYRSALQYVKGFSSCKLAFPFDRQMNSVPDVSSTTKFIKTCKNCIILVYTITLHLQYMTIASVALVMRSVKNYGVPHFCALVPLPVLIL